MKAEAIEHTLADGTTLMIRSLGRGDALSAVKLLSTILKQSPFLAMECEEWKTTEEQEQSFLETALSDPKRCMLGAFVDEALVGMADFSPVSTRMRMSHRAQCGISVTKQYQNRKIGRFLMKRLLSLAKDAGYEQMELQVDSTNACAIHLYRSLSFVQSGTYRRGMKHKDGHYSDLDVMIAFLV